MRFFGEGLNNIDICNTQARLCGVAPSFFYTGFINKAEKGVSDEIKNCGSAGYNAAVYGTERIRGNGNCSGQG